MPPQNPPAPPNEANMFSPMLSDLNVSSRRRIFHSFKNYFSTASFNPEGVINAGSQFMNVAGVAAGAAGIAGTAFALTAFAVAVAGPQAAVTLGVIGILMAIKGSYSNREAAHRTLTKYTWNMVDTEAPEAFTGTTLNEAGDAASYLISQGQNQYELAASKLQAASAGFTQYLESLDRSGKRLKYSFEELERTSYGHIGNQIRAQIDRIRAEARAGWETAMKPGGAIFEYVRRCAHTGNYLQAPHIFHLQIMERLEPGSVLNGPTTEDPFKENPLFKKSRENFFALEDAYTDEHKRFKIFGK